MDSEISYEYQLSPRIVLRPGDRFRVTRGPMYHGQPFGLRGEFSFRYAVHKGKRVWIEGARVFDGHCGGVYSLYVEGRAYRHREMPGIIMRPYKVRQMKATTRRKGQK